MDFTRENELIAELISLTCAKLEKQNNKLRFENLTEREFLFSHMAKSNLENMLKYFDQTSAAINWIHPDA